MDHDVYIITHKEEYWIGQAGSILADFQHEPRLTLAIRDIVDDLVFDPGSRDYAVLTVELR